MVLADFWSDVGNFFYGVWIGILSTLWNPFAWILYIAIGVILLLLIFKPGRNFLGWCVGFCGIQILITIVLLVLLIGMATTGVINGYQTASTGQSTFGTCQPADDTSFPPPNPVDAISMLCASNVALIGEITVGGAYVGVHLIAPSGQVMTATLPQGMCFEYYQNNQTSFDQSKVTIVNASNAPYIVARTTDVLPFTNSGVDAYGPTGTPCG